MRVPSENHVLQSPQGERWRIVTSLRSVASSNQSTSPLTRLRCSATRAHTRAAAQRVHTLTLRAAASHLARFPHAVRSVASLRVCSRACAAAGRPGASASDGERFMPLCGSTAGQGPPCDFEVAEANKKNRCWGLLVWAFVRFFVRALCTLTLARLMRAFSRRRNGAKNAQNVSHLE
jgi:hypothetical protein